MPLLDQLKRDHERLEAIAARHRATNLRVFGSVVRGEETADSDLDILVDWLDGASLTDWSALKLDIEEALGRPVDVVSGRALHWYIRDKILAEAVPLA